MSHSRFARCRPWRFFPALAILPALLSVGQLLAAAGGAAPKSFSLPAGSAAQSLKQFSEQSGRGVVFVTETVKDVRTNPVQGELAPAAALSQMLAGTVLAAEEDAKTGAFAVRKRESDPNASRAALPTASDRPRDNLTGDSEKPLQLSPFEVAVDNKGYYGANAMSGTRLNTKLEDIPSAISVVTKEQMQDFALLDLNHIFAMEVSTEGTSNYTALSFTNASTGIDSDFTQPTPPA